MQKTSPRNEDILERGDSRELTSENTGINVHPNHASSVNTQYHPTISSPVENKPTPQASNIRQLSPTVRINLDAGGKILSGRPKNIAEKNDNKLKLIEKGPHSKQRKWRAHQGRNRFFCNGRFIIARQSSILLLTLFLTVFTMTLFSVFDLPYLSDKVSLAIPIVSIALFLFVLSSLFRTALSDPGIIPRASAGEVLEWEKQCQESDPFFQEEEWDQPRTRAVTIRGQPITLKYCSTCCVFRPPRASHCSICDNCVLNFDHHCPWLGNCVGLRNYRHYYMFITSFSLLDAFMGFCVGYHLYLLNQDRGSFLEAMKESPPSMLTGLINVISIWFVLRLFGFHTYLLALGQTTNEDIKGTFNKKLDPQVFNPYSTGNCVKNILLGICSPERPSLIDRKSFLPPEEGPSIYVDADLLNQHKTRICHSSNLIAPVESPKSENN